MARDAISNVYDEAGTPDGPVAHEWEAFGYASECEYCGVQGVACSATCHNTYACDACWREADASDGEEL